MTRAAYSSGVRRVLTKLFLLVLMAGPVGAGGLPGFDEFRRIDRLRRLTGQLQTAELLEVSRLDAQRLIATAQRHPGDWQAQWGAAELLLEWPNKRLFFEAALAASQTNIAVAARYAWFAARQRDREVALPWLRYVAQKESDNLTPWLVELWLLTPAPPAAATPLEEIRALRPALWATVFRDYAAGAGRARVRLLEAAGYSPYAARRLGFMPETPPALMARELGSRHWEEEAAREILTRTARAMQAAAPFLLYEFIGQSLETALAQARPDRAGSAEARLRAIEIENRREELKTLLAEVERNAIDIATEAEMIRYFDDVLVLGEEMALRRLLAAVRPSR
jgi:hypothetical protein